MQNRHPTRHAPLDTIVFIVGLVVNQPAFAIETLPDITVTAPKQPLIEHISNTQQLNEDDIAAAHERSIADVIQGLPGVGASKTAGFGQPGSLFMRGSGGQGLVSLDDIPVILTVPGLLNLDTLPAEAVKSVEIERGPGAAYQPFQSLGGAIRLKTQDREDTGGRLSIEGGSFGILRETLQGGLKGDSGRLTATLSRADAFDGINLANQKQNPEREPTHYTQGILKFSTEVNNRLNWQGSLLYRNSGADIDTFGIDRNGIVALQDDNNSHAHEENWLTQTKLDYQVNNKWDSQLQLGYGVRQGPITVNVPDASIAGMELDAQYIWENGLETGLSYSFSDNVNLTNQKDLPYRPAHIGRVWGQKKLAQLPMTLWAEAIVRNSTFNDVDNRLPVNRSILFNAAIRYAVSQRLELYLRGENLTNNRTGQFYGTSMPGAAVYGGFKLDF
jgi:outer membrane cobalamin receptor